MRTLTFALLALIPLMAGCTDGGGAKVATINLEYDGSGSGDHEENLQCDADGQFNGSGKVEDGQLKVIVRDGNGDSIFERTYDGDFDFESESVSGQEGRWTLRAERMGDDLVGDEFRGKYTFNLTC